MCMCIYVYARVRTYVRVRVCIIYHVRVYVCTIYISFINISMFVQIIVLTYKFCKYINVIVNCYIDVLDMSIYQRVVR